MSTSEAGGTPPTQPALFGRPPRPPKITARGIEDQPNDPNRTIFISDPVVVADLAEALNVKPFKIVARLLEMRLFRHVDEAIDFDIASRLASEYGYRTERTNPGFFTP
jgi:translation initiation factor IF-2